MMNWFSLALAASLAFGATTVAAQDLRTERLAFEAGRSSATFQDEITGRESVSYLIGAEAGQRMVIGLESVNASLYFNVYAPGSGPGDQALATGDRVGPMMPDLNAFDGVLPSSGDYTISVYLFRDAARDGETAPFTMTVGIEPLGAAVEAPVQGDFADGLQGGPDFWKVQVATVLNLHNGPSGAAAVVGQLSANEVVRNLGCRMNEARRWCRVATQADPGLEGWAAGEFLVESGPGG